MRALVVAVAVVAIVAGCGGTDEEAAAPVATPEVAEPRASDRPPAPSIEGTTLDGEAVSLEDFRGRPVLVNVWSSW